MRLPQPSLGASGNQDQLPDVRSLLHDRMGFLHIAKGKCLRNVLMERSLAASVPHRIDSALQRRTAFRAQLIQHPPADCAVLADERRHIDYTRDAKQSIDPDRAVLSKALDLGIEIVARADGIEE